MTIMEYLQKNVSYINKNIPIELKDVIDERGVYCGGYNDLIDFLNSNGMEHIKNARYIQQQDDCNIILYIKDIQYYSDFDLEKLVENLKG